MPRTATPVAACVGITASLCLAFALLAGTSATGAVYYVAPSGNDANPGTEQQPWATINRGDVLRILHAGDTVVVQEGIYHVTGYGAELKNCSGGAGNPITYQADGRAIVDGGGVSFGWVVWADHIDIDGFEIRNCTYGLDFVNSTGHTARNCVVHDCSHAGLYTYGSDHVSFHHNLVYDIAPLDAASACVWAEKHGYVEVINNTLVNSRCGVRMFSSDASASIVNNIITRCFLGINFYQTQGAPGNAFNLYWQNAYDYLYYVAPGPGEIHADPMFVDAAATDYRLAQNSPAIDHGIDAGLPFEGLAPDIGAYESSYSSTAGTVTGVVLSSATGQPLAGALVEIEGTPIRRTTGQDGIYEIVLPGGVYTLQVSAAGFTSYYTSVTVAAGQQVTRDVVLQKAGTRTFYVSAPTGSDGNTGDTPESAWRTINRGDALGILRPGDTVVVMEGTYQVTGYGAEIKNCSGSPGLPITYRAQGRAIVDGGGTSFGWVVWTNHVDIDGFEIRNCTYGLDFVNSTGHTARFCTVYDCTYAGLYTYGSTGVTFHHNLVYSSDSGQDGGSCIWLEKHQGVRVLNNTLSGGSYGVRAFSSSAPLEVRNNVLTYCGTGLDFSQPSGALANSHNIYFGNTQDLSGAASPGVREMRSDPKLDAQFHPLHSSPAINTGLDVGLPFTGPNPDIGAFETDSTASRSFVEGSVIDSDTHAPVAGATVATADGVFAGNTGTDGAYQIVVDAGLVTLQADARGFTGASSSATIVAGATARIDFQLTRLPPRTYYVDAASGNDLNSGLSGDLPWRTIGRGDALGVLNPGDVVLVRAGTYPQSRDEGVTLRNCGGDSQLPIRYVASGRVVVLPRLPASSSLVRYGFSVQVPYISIEGFEITGCSVGVDLSAAYGSSTVAGCSVHSLQSSPDGWTAGVLVRPGSGATIRNCLIVNISMEDRSNTRRACVTALEPGDLRVHNNTIYGAYYGVFVMNSGRAADIRNNIVLGCQSAIRATSQAGALLHSNNLFWANSVDFDGFLVPSATELSANPKFDASWRPRPGSPAINTGSNVGLPFSGPAPDMGAFETLSTDPPPIIRGTVTDSRLPGQPLANARVTVIQTGTSGWTGTDGSYRVPAPGGTCTLSIERPGFVAAVSPPIAVQSGEETIQDIALTPATDWTLAEARRNWKPMTRAVQHVGVPGYQFQAAVMWDGSLVFGPQGFADLGVMRKERAPLGNNQLHVSVGFGRQMRFADRTGTGDPAVKRRLEDGRLPIPCIETTDSGLVWTEQVFSHLLGQTPEDGMAPLPEDVLTVHSRFHVKNVTGTPRVAQLWLHFGTLSQVQFGYKCAIGKSLAPSVSHTFQPPFGTVDGLVRYVLPRPAKGALVWHDQALVEYAQSPARRVIEWRVALAPGEEADLRLLIPYGLVDAEAAQRILALDSDAVLQDVRRFWRTLEAGPGQITTPDPFVNDYLAAVTGQMSQQVACRLNTGVWMYKTSPNWYEAYWPCNAGKALPTLDFRGLQHISAPVLQSFIDTQTDDPGALAANTTGEGYARIFGFMGNFGEWTANTLLLSHGMEMWALARHYRITRDDVWLHSGTRTPLQAMISAFDWVSAQRRRTMREVNGQKVAWWGLLPSAQAHDWLAGNTIFNDAYCIYGMSEIVQLLSEIGHPRAADMAAELNAYRSTLRERYMEARDKAVPVPADGGLMIPYVPRAVQELDWRGIDWTYTGYGPLRAGAWGALAPDDELVTQALRFLDSGMPRGQGPYVGVSPGTADFNWSDISNGSAPRHFLWRNLVEYETMWPIGYHIFLARDDPGRYSEWLFNNLAAVVHPDFRVGVESLDGVPSCAPGDGDRWQGIRAMLVNERGGYDGSGQSLWLCQAIPKCWLRPGDRLTVSDMPTCFGGRINLSLQMDTSAALCRATVNLAGLAVTPASIVLRLRSGDSRRLAGAMVNGAPVTVLPNETVILPSVTSGQFQIIAWYR